MSKRKTIKAEERIRIAKACINGETSAYAAADRIGVHSSVVDDWIRQYQEEGPEAFLPREEKRRYDPALKEAAVKAYLSSKGSLREICREYKIRDKRQLRSWIRVYNGHKDFKKQTGGSRMTKGRETTQAERIAVAKACIANGRNYGEAALEDRRGQRKKDQQPRTELEQAQIEIEQLKHKLKMLEIENHLLKKLKEIEGRDR